MNSSKGINEFVVPTLLTLRFFFMNFSLLTLFCKKTFKLFFCAIIAPGNIPFNNIEELLAILIDYYDKPKFKS